MAKKKPNTDPAHYGVHIQVLDLTKMKAFCRDVIKLGEPQVDSTFWVEFALPGRGILALEQCDNVTPGGRKREVAWMLRVDDYDARVKELKTWKVKEVRPSVDVPGKRCTTFTDPEGNPFTVYGDLPVDEDA